MARRAMHTFANIYVHVVFATWSRRPFIERRHRDELHRYLSGAARNLGIADVEIGGVEDHIHLLGRIDTAAAIAHVIGKIKQSSTRWMHEEGRRKDFRWQRGFSAFSVSVDRLPFVVRYIRSQEQHHATRTFADELTALLKSCGVSIDQVQLL